MVVVVKRGDDSRDAEAHEARGHTEGNTMTKLTTKAAIEQAMKGSRKPMRVSAIIEAGVPLSRLAGKTPGQGVYSVLYGESKKADGLVVQTGKGEFKLNPKRRRAQAARA